MRLLGRELLRDFAHKHADVAPQIDVWSSEVIEAKWATPQELKIRYPNASVLSRNRVVFNLKGNRYRLLAVVNYTVGVVVVDKIGTHSEYSRWNL